MSSGKADTDSGDAPPTYTFPSGSDSEAIALTFSDDARGRPTATLKVIVNRAPAPELVPEPRTEPVIEVPLPKKVKPGTYVIEVRVTTPKGKRVGKTVRRTLTLE